ncbi:FKBP-type peptidyl-prolyl cis-trans isomerase [Natronococcus occultus]|uniref:Peptidyl-prolyl cis-trans isomerase n=1 Tax=Natronococcus occultus SP4 TaxID=694430 RepID=L0K1P9_9EURY|nr:FKBP-type peptidyl-prolyl cis-trans isomerase [Natronococcus occultus]AGB38911.1 FKBP-type peptidyl-prolyl cis-trans isomerase [Natronococcus occultus SP4]
MAIETGDSVTIEYTARFEDGLVFDTTRERVAEETGLAEQLPDREFEPLTFEVGDAEIIDGVTEALVGMEEGAETTITVPPEDAYGERSEDRVIEHNTVEFEQMLESEGRDLEMGAEIETKDGSVGEITHIDPEIVRIDFNHQLAGETLEFDLEVLEVN